MDTPQEQQTAATIEGAIPGSTATVEEVQTPTGPVEVAVIEGAEPNPPRDEMDLGYKFGRLEARLAQLESQNSALLAQLAAFEAATVAAIETEADELAQQGAVVADVAEEVLPEDHEAATAHNPDHGSVKGKFWERLMGGHHHG